VEQTEAENATDISENVHSAIGSVAGVRAVISLACARHCEEGLVVSVGIDVHLFLFNKLAVFFEHFDRFFHSDFT